jgi:hypothetical protein
MAKPEPAAGKATSLNSDLHSDFIPVRFEADQGIAQTINHAPVSGPLDIQVRRGDLVVQIQTKQSSLAECANLLAALFR